MIQTNSGAYGTTSLTEIGDEYFLYNGGSGPPLSLFGTQVVAGEFGGWVLIGAVQTASGYDIAWEVPGANQYTVWTTDSSGNYLSNIFGAVPGNSPALELLEIDVQSRPERRRGYRPSDKGDPDRHQLLWHDKLGRDWNQLFS